MSEFLICLCHLNVISELVWYFILGDGADFYRKGGGVDTRKLLPVSHIRCRGFNSVLCSVLIYYEAYGLENKPSAGQNNHEILPGKTENFAESPKNFLREAKAIASRQGAFITPTAAAPPINNIF